MVVTRVGAAISWCLCARPHVGVQAKGDEDEGVAVTVRARRVLARR